MSEQDNFSVASKEYPLVSVFIGVYNHAPYVQECLDSIVNTRYPNLELFIVNDASPDDSDEKIRCWLAKHSDLTVAYIVHEQNQGLISSLNEVIDLATGEFFCPIASDDVMCPNGIIDRVSYLQQHKSKLAVFADCQVIDGAGNVIHESGIKRTADPEFNKSDLNIDALVPYYIVFHWSVPGPVFMCRKEAFDIVGYFDNELLVEDWDMFLRFAAIARLGYYDGYVAKYRIHEKNWSRASDGRIKSAFQATLLKDYKMTVRKNIKRFKGIMFLRLLAYQLTADWQEAQRGVRKWMLSVAKFLVMGVSYRTYLLVRRLYRHYA